MHAITRNIMDFNLAGRQALVTGLTAGIGLAIARELAQLGATVAINGRTQARVAQAIAKLEGEAPGRRFTAAPGDVGNAAGAREVLAAVPAADILVNNAGIFEPKPFFEIPDESGGHADLDSAGRAFVKEHRPTSVLGRLTSTEEVAHMVAYICSPAASATTGAALRVDGGVVRAIV
jgi:NAD(P)-dependent dehydrogenase (short-subunit alcohol dehydrogenase family)